MFYFSREKIHGFEMSPMAEKRSSREGTKSSFGILELIDQFRSKEPLLGSKSRHFPVSLFKVFDLINMIN